MQIQMIPMHSAVFAASPLSHPSILLRRQRGEFKNQQISRSLPIELLGPAAICQHTSPGLSAGLWQILTRLWCVPQQHGVCQEQQHQTAEGCLLGAGR